MVRNIGSYDSHRKRKIVMVATNFERSLAAVLKHEGGYVDHPRDPGGATNLGITIGTLRTYRGRAVTKADVKALTRAEAAAIYRKNYWDKIRGDELPKGVDYAVFDFAVNSGMGRAIPFLQRVVSVTADGKFGPATMEAMRQMEPSAIVAMLCARRLAWLQTLGTWSTFGKGWASRVNGVKKLGLQMAGEAPIVAVRPPPDIPAPEPPQVPVQRPVETVDDEADPIRETPVLRPATGWAGLLQAIVKALFGR